MEKLAVPFQQEATSFYTVAENKTSVGISPIIAPGWLSCVSPLGRPTKDEWFIPGNRFRDEAEIVRDNAASPAVTHLLCAANRSNGASMTTDVSERVISLRGGRVRTEWLCSAFKLRFFSSPRRHNFGAFGPCGPRQRDEAVHDIASPTPILPTLMELEEVLSSL